MCPIGLKGRSVLLQIQAWNDHGFFHGSLCGNQTYPEVFSGGAMLWGHQSVRWPQTVLWVKQVAVLSKNPGCL